AYRPGHAAGSAGARSRTDHEGPASGPFWDEKTPRMMLQSPFFGRSVQSTPGYQLQFRRKPAVAGKRRLGVIGLGWVGQGFMQQAARLAQRATAGLALQAQRQLHVFQEREEAEVLLAVDDHAVPIGEQSVAGRPGATVQFLVALT